MIGKDAVHEESGGERKAAINECQCMVCSLTFNLAIQYPSGEVVSKCTSCKAASMTPGQEFVRRYAQTLLDDGLRKERVEFDAILGVGDRPVTVEDLGQL